MNRFTNIIYFNIAVVTGKSGNNFSINSAGLANFLGGGGIGGNCAGKGVGANFFAYASA